MMIGLRVDIMFILWMLFLIVLSELSLQQYYTFAFTASTQLSTRHINDINCNINNDQDDNIILTTALIKCAYDGNHFRGWTAGNSITKVNDKAKGNTNKHSKSTQQQPNRRQSRRSRTLQRKGGSYGYNRGRIRTVDDTIRMALAKVYGDVNPKQIKIEACSRTDAGVHAESLVAQFYCIKNDKNATQSTSIQRPKSYNDTDYLPLPFDSSLSKLVYVLNRMLPPDVRIVCASPLPHVSSSVPIRGISANLPSSNEKSDTGIASFHPTLHTISKTYKYQFALGPVHDPIKQNYLWHLDGSSSRAVGMNGNKFCLERALAAANLFVDSNDENINIDTAIERDYGAFRAAFRGTDRGRVQSTICKLWRCDILEERKELLPSWEAEASSDDKSGGGEKRFGGRLGQSAFGTNDTIHPQTFTVVITGNRFLYKMMRNIVGTIVAVGCGHIELDDVSSALETGKWGSSDEDEQNHIRRICAPARGLTLIDVHYHPDIIFDWQTG